MWGETGFHHTTPLVLALGVGATTIAVPDASETGRVHEATVRRLSPASVPDVASPDIYFNVQIATPPVVGTAQLAALARLHGSERKNEKPHEYTITQLFASADGSMAYDDGSVRVEFDDVASGKHVSGGSILGLPLAPHQPPHFIDFLD